MAAARAGASPLHRRILHRFQTLLRADAGKCSAAWIGALLTALVACGTPPAPPAPRVYAMPAPDAGGERSCAWFGDVSGSTLYFGVSAFWSALRAAGGDPLADLAAPGPLWVGRFDLAGERFLPPLVLAPEGAATGVWDVLVHPNGWVYFTTYFDFAGRVHPERGDVERFPGAGPGLNELALGPGGAVLATRYGVGESVDGALVVLSERGEIVAEHVLPREDGVRALAKSLAFDPRRQEVWLNTDLLSLETGEPAGHDARALAADGRERLRIREPELQFFAFTGDGTGDFAEVDGDQLRLRQRSPRGLDVFVPLDHAFPPALDFAQELRVEADGSRVITRWSGRVYVVGADLRVRELALPQRAGDLYYTATRTGSRVCATRCGGVEVVCADLSG
jgi:hypothetical protein